MFKAVIYNTATLVIHNRYKTVPAAKGALTRMSKDANVDPLLKVATVDEYNELNVEVTVYSLMNGAPIVINASQVNGPCDPSTERYWSM